jgi:serine protease Do
MGKASLQIVVSFAALTIALVSPAHAQYPRRSAIVEAVQKTRAGIVCIKSEKKNQWGRNTQSLGTGVIVDDRGYVVSNRHVIEGTVHVRVALCDGTEWDARVLVEDPLNDLAILHIRTPGKLSALTLGPGSDLMVGETVIAIGNPYGYANTVSTGIISALGREVGMPSGETLSNLIQTSASINPGNSGGPLLNINGELIGINVALREGAQGIAFAINADTVKLVLSRQLGARKVSGIEHGLTCKETIVPEAAQRQRVVVEAVAHQTPAAAAGLQRGDQILRVAGQTVGNRFDVERALWDRKPGEQVPFTVLRQGKELTVGVTLASIKAGPQKANAH